MRDPERIGEDRQNRIHPRRWSRAANRRSLASSDPPNPAARIGDRGRRVGTHPAGSGLVLAAARHHVLRVGSVDDRRGGTGRPQPVGSALPQKLLHREVVGVQPTAEPGDRDAQAVGHRGVEPKRCRGGTRPPPRLRHHQPLTHQHPMNSPARRRLHTLP
jgi:hypothetical protein